MRIIIAALTMLIAIMAILLILDSANKPAPTPPLATPPAQPQNDYPVNRFYEESDKIAYAPNGTLRIIHRVTWDEQAKLYVYSYRLEHVGENTVIINWQVLDEVFGTKKMPLLVILSATGDGAKKEFTFKSKQPPKRLEGPVSVYDRSEDGQLWSYGVQVPIAGPIPTDALPSVERPLANGAEVL